MGTWLENSGQRWKITSAHVGALVGVPLCLLGFVLPSPAFGPLIAFPFWAPASCCR
jgi:hypothetical protein